MAVSGDTTIDEGLNALSWVHDELRRSLEAAHKSLRRYLRVAAESTDLDPVDPAILRQARTQLHQAVGAVELVGLGPAGLVLRAGESALQRLSLRPKLITQAAVDAIERGSFALLDFVGRRLANKPVTPLSLFPQYRVLQELAGASRIHPADLWPVSWSWRNLPLDRSAAARLPDAQSVAMVEAGLLAQMRGAPPSVAARMSEVFTGLSVGLLQSLPPAAPGSEPVDHVPQRQLASLWQLAAAFYEAQADGLLRSDLFSKRIGSRLLSQLRAGQGAEPSTRLAHDLLFFCSQATPRGGMPVLGLGHSGRLAAVRAAYALADEPVVDFEVSRLGRFDPTWVTQARKRVSSAKEFWSTVAGGDLSRLPGLVEQMQLVADSLQRLYPDGGVLGRALIAAAQHTVAADAEPSAELAMEVATALLYLDASLDDADFDQPELSQRMHRLAQRIDQVRNQRDPGMLELWMEDLYRRVSDRQTMGNVVQELRASLSEVEKHIDQYFRHPSQRDVLFAVPAQLQAMRGVLSVLGLDQASQAVLRMSDDVDLLADTEVDPQQAVQSGSFERLADNLGALSFLIDMVAVQPQMAKSLFRFDPRTGNLSAVMAREERQSGFSVLDSEDAPDTQIKDPSPDTDAVAVSLEFDRIVQQSKLNRRDVGAESAEGLPMMSRHDLTDDLSDDSDMLPTPAFVDSRSYPRAEPDMQALREETEASTPDASAGAEIDIEMREVFLDEARELLDSAGQGLDLLDESPADLPSITQVRRAFHTLKGSARMVGLMPFGEAVWACEQLFNSRLAADQPETDAALRAFSMRAVAYFEQWVEALAIGDAEDFGPEGLLDTAQLPPGKAAPARAAVPGAAAGSLRERVRDLPSPADLDLDQPTMPAMAIDLAPLPDAEALPPFGWTPLPDLAELSELADATSVPAPLSASGTDDLPAFEAQDLPADLEDIEVWPESLSELDDVGEATRFGGFDQHGDALPPLPAAAPTPVHRGPLPGERASAGLDATLPLPGPLAFSQDPAMPPLDAPSIPEPEPEPGDGAEPDLLLEPPADQAQPVLVTDHGGLDLSLDESATAALRGPFEDSEVDLPLDMAEPTAPAPMSAPVAARWDASRDQRWAPNEERYKQIGPLRVSLPLFNIFINEADELSRQLSDALSLWRQQSHRPVGEVAVSKAHSLAGSSGTVGYGGLSELARQLEQALGRSRERGHGAGDEPELFMQAADEIRRLLHLFAAGFLNPVDPGMLRRLSQAGQMPAGGAQAPEHVPLFELSDFGRSDMTPFADMPELPRALPASAHAGLAFDDDIDQVDAIDDELFPVFEEEALELLPRLHASLRDWSRRPGDTASASACMRSLHTFKGGARLAGAMRLGEMAHRLETAIEHLTARQMVTNAGDIEALVHHADTLEMQFDAERASFLINAGAAQAPEHPQVTSSPASASMPMSWLPPSPSAAPDERVGPEATSQAWPAPEQGDALPPATDAGLYADANADADADADAADEIDADISLESADDQAATAAAIPAPDAADKVDVAEPEQAIERAPESAAEANESTPALAVPATDSPAEAGTEAEAEARAQAPETLDPALPQVPGTVPASPMPMGSTAPAPAPTARGRRAGAADPAMRRHPADVNWTRFLQTAAPANEQPAVSRPAAGSVRVRAAILDRLVGHSGEVSIARARIETDVQQFKGALGELSDNLERLRSQLRELELQGESQIGSRLEAARQAQQQFDPLEMDRFTRFQELTRMMAESVGDVATVQRSLQRTLQSTEDTLAHQQRMSRDMQDDLLRTRLVEFEGLSERLYRVVRQAAKETGKPVRLDIVGGSIEVDRGVLDRMTPAFEHLLRNSVVHGIESAEQRAAAGKDATGNITVTVGQLGNEVAVEVRDDGAGLNLGRIRERALAMGLLASDTPADENELANLIFQPGFSTAHEVTEMAGRGVGMDVVRTEVNAIGGRIETSTALGQGASFKLVLPLTTAVTQVVMLRCGQRSVAVPSTLVESVTKVPPAEIEASYERGTAKVADRELPFFWMDALLNGAPRGAVGGRNAPLVVVRSASRRVVLHVDEVTSNQEVVVKHLGPQLSRLPGLVGMTLLPSGQPALIYNPVPMAALHGAAVQAQVQALLRGAPAGGHVEPGAPAAAPVAPLVMVVDDSLTVRRVTQRLLEREGYRVLLAKDGQDALDRLSAELPQVVLSDIEMPRMDGFDLLRSLRATPRLAGLPVIMITSRLAQKHRVYAAELGANHYLGKPYAEDELLALVARYAPHRQPDKAPGPTAR